MARALHYIPYNINTYKMEPKNKAQTKAAANKKKNALKAINPNDDISVYKFAGKRKWQFFVGTWWQWLAAIS